MIGCWLAATGLLAAEEPDVLRVAAEEPGGGLSRIARSATGGRGANQWFYFPTRDEPATPASWGFNYENVEFASGDGTLLHGWFIPARGRDPVGTIVFSHGNAGSVGHHLGFVMWLVEAGYHVLMFDYRGFGKSGGRVGRRGMVDDVKAAFSHVAGRADVDARRLVSYGHSLGGAKSVTALGERPVKGLRAVVIDGTFASYQAMARVIGGRLGESLVTDDLSPGAFVRKLSPVPLLVVHGTLDEVVPVSQGRLLFEAAGQPKTMFEVKSGHHGDSLARDRGAYRKRMLAWLAESMSGG